MSILKSFAYLDGNIDCIVNASIGYLLSQGSPLDELHDDEHPAGILLDTVNRTDVRMVQCGGGTRLLEKKRFVLLRSVEVRGKKLQSDETVEFGIPGFVDNTHAAFTELFEDSVVGNDGGNQWRLLHGNEGSLQPPGRTPFGRLPCQDRGKRDAMQGTLPEQVTAIGG